LRSSTTDPAGATCASCCSTAFSWGAILFGDTSAGLAVKAAIEGKLDCSGLLLGAPSAADLLRHLAQANPSTRAG